MKLYGGSGSPFFVKCRVVLEEKSIPHETEMLVPVPKTPELLALNPIGKIPILRDGDVVVPDSSVICAYLEKKYPSPAVYPSDPAELAKALFLEEYADTRLAEPILGVVFERFVKPHVMGQASDEARVSSCLTRDLPPALDYLESQLSPDRDTLLDRFSIADAALGGQLAALIGVGEDIDARRWPRTAQYARALRARPSFETALAG
jgi:glutathione S-transferase